MRKIFLLFLLFLLFLYGDSNSYYNYNRSYHNEFSEIESSTLLDFLILNNSVNEVEIKDYYLKNKKKILLYFNHSYDYLDIDSILSYQKVKNILNDYLSLDSNNKKYTKEVLAILMGLNEFETNNKIISGRDYIYLYDDRGHSFKQINKKTGSVTLLGNFTKLHCGFLPDFVDWYEGIGITFKKVGSIDSSNTSINGYSETQQVNKNGVRVIGVSHNSPAEKAGILKGDIILKINDIEILQEMEISKIAQLFQGKIGSQIMITLKSGNEVNLERGKIYNIYDKKKYDDIIELIGGEDFYVKIKSHKEEVIEASPHGDRFGVSSYICKNEIEEIIVFYEELGITMKFDKNGKRIYSLRENYFYKFGTGIPQYMNDDYIIFKKYPYEFSYTPWLNVYKR